MNSIDLVVLDPTVISRVLLGPSVVLANRAELPAHWFCGLGSDGY